MAERDARRLDVCCNDPDNGLFTGRADAFQIETWDGALLEFEPRRWGGPKFSESPGVIRLCRRNWPILTSKDWYGNWCWNAYWLAPTVLIDLLATLKKSRLFHCGCGISQLFDNWNDDDAPLDRDLWAANLSGRPTIGFVDTGDDARREPGNG